MHQQLCCVLDLFQAVTNCRRQLQKQSIDVSSKVKLNERVLGYERHIAYSKTQIISIDKTTATEKAAISSKQEKHGEMDIIAQQSVQC